MLIYQLDLFRYIFLLYNEVMKGWIFYFIFIVIRQDFHSFQCCTHEDLFHFAIKLR